MGAGFVCAIKAIEEVGDILGSDSLTRVFNGEVGACACALDANGDTTIRWCVS
jgi:hypothetical protein